MPFDDDADDEAPGFGQPLPPEDRLWRHPSELGGTAPPSGALATAAAAIGATGAPHVPWGVALVSGLIGAVLAVGVVAVAGGLEPEVVERQVIERVPGQPVTPMAASADGRGGVTAAARAVLPAITQLDVETGSGPVSGSAVVFRDNGYLLTNAHVVDEAMQVVVRWADGDELEADVMGVDPHTDIAVLKVEADDLATATLGSAIDLQVGEPAVAVGSPLGLAGGPSVTLGVVSALGRRISPPESDPLYDMIQTDAPIAPGSSGGALLDGSGAVIGITTAVALGEVGSEALGFATPIDMALSVADEIITTGQARHVWLGVEGTDLDRAIALQLAVAGGAVVRTVIDGTPAADAGLAEDDVIVSVQGSEVRSMAALVVTLRDYSPGDAVQLGIMRDGRPETRPVTLAERPGR